MKLPDTVQGDGAGFGHGGGEKVDMVRHPEEVGRGHGYVFRESSVAPRAEIVVALALSVIARTAGAATPALKEGVDHDAIARRVPGCRGGFGDQTGELVSHDEGVVVGLAMEGPGYVRTAYSGMLDPHEDLVRGRRRRQSGFAADKNTIGFEYKSFHAAILHHCTGFFNIVRSVMIDINRN